MDETALPADRFRACLNQTLGWEGGFSNDKYDAGGATMRGVTQAEYNRWRVRHTLEKKPVNEITRAEWEAIYHEGYWEEVNGDKLPGGVDLVTFDYGVNSGPQVAIRCLQRAVGAIPDGHMGQQTLDCLERRDPDEVVAKMMAERRAFLRSLKNFWRFGSGWMTRCNGIERTGLQWGGADPHAYLHIPEAAPHADENVQAASQGKAVVKTPQNVMATPGGQAALVSTGSGTTISGIEVANAASQAYTPGVGFDALHFALLLLQSPGFWTGAALVYAGVLAWRERHQILRWRAA